MSKFSIRRKAEPHPVFKTAITVLLLMLSLQTFSQSEPFFDQLEPFLLLEKPGTKKRIRYYTGDAILFKLHNSNDFYFARITAFTDSSFFISNQAEIPLRTVKLISDKSKRQGIKGLSMVAVTSIPGLFVLSAGNNIFNTGKRPIIDREVYTLSGAFLGIAALGAIYPHKKYRLKNKWRIIVVMI